MAQKAPNAVLDEARIQRAKDVGVVFVDGNNFNIIYLEDEFNKKMDNLKIHDKGDMKYMGKIIDILPNIDDNCTCPSFYHGNGKTFQDENGFAFQCKHLIKARSLRYDNHPEVKTNGLRKDTFYESSMIQKDLLL